ncbi:MAG: hypothetical protein EXS05_16000 [Planctomycetaceae bacterium]|nr:hypothetical protein [Planctomycetaceae bacterium]
MLLRKTLLAVCALGLVSSIASAQVKLERKLKEGLDRTTEMTTRTEQKLTIAGMERDTASQTRMTIQSTVGKRDDAGNLRVQEKIKALQVTMQIMGTDYSFDSASPDAAGSSPVEFLRPIHKGLSQRTATTTYDKKNEVAAIEFDQDILGNLAEEVRNFVKSEFDTEKLKQAANEEAKRLPTDPVKKGDTWERTEKMNLGSGQIMTIATRYTYEGEVEKDGRKLDRITSSVLSTAYSLENPTPQLTVKSSELKPAESKGEILFDRELGIGVETSSLLRITGEMTLVIDNVEYPAKLDLKMESSTQPKS